jgi:hypothetical protein
MIRTVELTNDSVVIDGRDVSHLVTGVDLRLEPGLCTFMPSPTPSPTPGLPKSPGCRWTGIERLRQRLRAMSDRTIQFLVDHNRFIYQDLPMVVVRGECEHGQKWVRSFTPDTDEILTDWTALDAYKEIVPAPSCDEHQTADG